MMETRPRVLAVVLGFIPSTMITVVKPLMNLHRAGRISARIVLESQARRGDIDWADVVVFCRNTEPRHAPLLAAVQARGTPAIYDLDDNLFDLPPDCEGGARLREAPRQAMLEEYVRSAALVRVYSQSLAERVALVNPRVVRTFAPIDLSRVPPLGETRPPGPIRIVYATSRTQDSSCNVFLPALARIASRYAGRIEVHFWGCRPPCHLVTLPNVCYHGLICRYDRFLRRFSRGGYDIGLAPLPDEPYYRSKSNNKFREYGACGIAGIYSHNEVYADCVEHEVSGLLVANETGGWHDAIERLIVDESLRLGIQRRAREYVREHYAQEEFDGLFLEQIHALLSPGADLATVEMAKESGRLNAAQPGFRCQAGSSATAACQPQPGFLGRLCHLARRSRDVFGSGRGTPGPHSAGF